MADIDVLPARGVPVLALVDSTGIASNGSQTVAQLAARGIRSVCAVDANGISLSGASVAQLASSGIRAFCPVDENGLAQDAVSTADILRRRGIRPMVLLNNTGVALTGSATVLTLAQRGLQAFCPVDEAGNATTMGAVILISNTTILDTATIGSNVGTLSVAGGTGTYTFTLTSNPGSLFATAGANGVNLNVAAALTAGIKPITVQAAGGVPTPISRTINITVNQAPTLPINTVAPVIAGTPQENQTLTVTNNGTWTGFPVPGFTYQWNRNPTTSAEATAWLARATGLDAAHIAADTAFINGLVADGIWAKLDVLSVLATQTSAIALLNMVSSSFTGVALGSPTFTVDRGFTGGMGSTSKAIDTQFNPITAVSPKYTQNSAHLSVWNVTHVANTGSAGACIGIQHAGSECGIYCAYVDGNSYYRPNTDHGTAPVADASGIGHYIASRTGPSSMQGYKDGAQVQNVANPSFAVQSTTIYVLAHHDFGLGVTDGTGSQVAAFSIGAGLTAIEAANFTNRLRTRLTAVGVP